MFRAPSQLIKDRVEVRRLARPFVDGATDEDLLRLVRHVGGGGGRNHTVHIAVVAVSMTPRPAWVAEIVGALETSEKEAPTGS